LGLLYGTDSGFAIRKAGIVTPELHFKVDEVATRAGKRRVRTPV